MDYHGGAGQGCDPAAPTPPPSQSWYYSPSTGRLSLALMAANIYRCFEGSCYVLTNHLPAATDMCLAHVAAISNDGIDTDRPGVHVWGGPLSGGAFVIGLENRGAAAADAEAQWAWLEAPGFGADSSACVRELFSDVSLGVSVGGVTVPALGSHDMAVLRVVPGAQTC